MKNNGNMVVLVDLDASKLESGVTEIAVRLSDLKLSLNNIKNAVGAGITGIQHSLGAMKTDISGAIEDAVENLFSGWTDAFAALANEIKILLKSQSQDEMVSNIVNKSYDTALALFLESVGVLGKAKKGDAPPSGTGNGSYSWGNGMPGQLALPSADMKQSPSTPGTILLPAAGSGGAARLGGVDDIVDGITSSGNGLLDGSLASAFSDITTKLKNSAAATWLQNAATTAWKGISTAATAVTTAFGAAMNFLTSPIGLVVLAITALIAIIVLLIANWDTVKAAVLTAWEAIKSALATAAEWFNTNVIQPIVGFFTSAMDWISVKVQEGMAIVQNIFAGISEFMQGVFAKDWTEQFGAFGNVLNAFFANVENVWSAVKSIFTGIVSFIKNVFAGDWGAAWDSIVSVFKGIWDYLVAIVKAPINIIIGMINGLVQGVVDGINLIINALNGLSFDIPDWVPVFGGHTFGLDITPLVAPKIPLLAKGAVLPANKRIYRYPFSEVLLMATGFQKADSLNGRRLLAEI